LGRIERNLIFIIICPIIIGLIFKIPKLPKQKVKWDKNILNKTTLDVNPAYSHSPPPQNHP
jgi:hypothetical protein